MNMMKTETAGSPMTRLAHTVPAAQEITPEIIFVITHQPVMDYQLELYYYQEPTFPAPVIRLVGSDKFTVQVLLFLCSDII